MTHFVSQRLAGSLRINPAGIHPSVKADDTLYAPFRSAVMDGLFTRMQKCGDESTRDALRQIADAFQQSKDITLPKCADKDGAPDKKAVNRFITGLIQNRLHDLDRRLSQSLHRPNVSAEWNRAVISKAHAESRLAPLLAAYERAADNPFLQTCLGEHVSALKQSSNIEDRVLLKYHLPDAIKQLEKQLSELGKSHTRNNSRRHDAFLQGLQSLVSAAIKANNSRIEQLTLGRGAYEKQDTQRLEIYYEKLAVLNTAFQAENAALEALADRLDGQKDVGVDIIRMV